MNATVLGTCGVCEAPVEVIEPLCEICRGTGRLGDDRCTRGCNFLAPEPDPVEAMKNALAKNGVYVDVRTTMLILFDFHREMGAMP